MGKNTGIAWASDTFNIAWGCQEVSEECTNCYARELDARFGGGNWGDGPRRFFGDKHWNEPLKWNREAIASGKPRRVFCSSMADVFEAREDLEPWRQKLWGLIRLTPALTWMLLTKRPQNITRMLADELRGAPNLWLGTTCGLPGSTWRVDALRKHAAHAVVRFVSMEPMLDDTPMDLADLHWIIQGSESGDKARSSRTAWFRRTRDQCVTAGVAYFCKQMDATMDGVSLDPPAGQLPSGSPPYRKRDMRTGPDGMKRNHWIIERPYLDGRQWLEFPAGAQ